MKNLMKKALLALLAAALVTGCSSGTGTSSAAGSEGAQAPAESTDSAAPAESGESSAAPAGSTVITYGLWSVDQEPIYKEILAKYTEQNPDVTFEFQVTPWADYWNKLQTTVTGGAAPDIFWMNIPRASDYISNGILVDLTDLGVDTSQFPATHIEAYTREGKLYGIPKDFDSVGVFYNKTMFEEKGVPLPAPGWTWEDMKSAAAALTDKDNDIFGIVAPCEWQGGYYECIYQNGSDPFTAEGKSNFGSPEVVEAVEYWYSFVEEGYSPDPGYLQNNKAKDLMLSGRTAMYVDGSWSCVTYLTDEYGKANIDCAELPVGKTKGTSSNALAHVIFSGSKNIDVARSAVEFLSTAESNETVANSGQVIPALGGTQEAWVAQYPGKNVQCFVDSVQFATHLPNWPNFSAAQDIEKQLLIQAWSGNGTVAETCAQIAEKANEVLG